MIISPQFNLLRSELKRRYVTIIDAFVDQLSENAHFDADKKKVLAEKRYWDLIYLKQMNESLSGIEQSLISITDILKAKKKPKKRKRK